MEFVGQRSSELAKESDFREEVLAAAGENGRRPMLYPRRKKKQFKK
jgi:hypothetical protein